MIQRWQSAPPALSAGLTVFLTSSWEQTQGFGSKLPHQQLPVELLKALQVDLQAPGLPSPPTQVLTLTLALPHSQVSHQLLWSSMGLALYLNEHTEMSNTTAGTQTSNRGYDGTVFGIMPAHRYELLSRFKVDQRAGSGTHATHGWRH